MMDDALVSRLRAAGCVFAEDEAAMLRAAANDEADLEHMAARRIAGEPLEVVVGYAAFAGLRIPVAAGVFVPRVRTELVARLAAQLAPPSSIVVDLCCGSGAIAAAVAHSRPDLAVWAADIDPAVPAARSTRSMRTRRCCSASLPSARCRSSRAPPAAIRAPIRPPMPPTAPTASR